MTWGGCEGGGTNISAHCHLSHNSYSFFHLMPRNHGNGVCCKVEFLRLPCCSRRGRSKACETHRHMRPGEGLTHVFKHQLPQWVSPVQALLPNSARVGPPLCIPPVALHPAPIISCMNNFLLIGPSAFRLAYFPSIFDSPFVVILHARESYAVTVTEGLHWMLFPSINLFINFISSSQFRSSWSPLTQFLLPSSFLFSSDRVESFPVYPPSLAHQVSSGRGTSSPIDPDRAAQPGEWIHRQATALGQLLLQLFRTHMTTELHICYICAGRPRSSPCVRDFFFLISK